MRGQQRLAGRAIQKNVDWKWQAFAFHALHQRLPARDARLIVIGSNEHEALALRRVRIERDHGNTGSDGSVDFGPRGVPLWLNRCPQYFRSAWRLCACITLARHKEIEILGRRYGLKGRR